MKIIPKEFKIGELTLVVNRPGTSSPTCFVTFLGAGKEGERPMLGTLPMTLAEVGELVEASTLEKWSPLRRVLRAWDWSSILVDGVVPEDAQRQLVAAMVLVEQAFNFDAKPAQVDDESRCAVCGWPLAASVAEGCVRGNCSERPLPTNRYAPERAEREARRG